MSWKRKLQKAHLPVKKQKPISAIVPGPGGGLAAGTLGKGVGTYPQLTLLQSALLFYQPQLPLIEVEET